MAKKVLTVGLAPDVIDFSAPDLPPGMTADKLRGALEKDIATLRERGYDADFCGTDYGETAGTVLREKLDAKAYDCVVIGAGVRMRARTTTLLETYVEAIRTHAPNAKIAFNTSPSDTAEAAERAFPKPE